MSQKKMLKLLDNQIETTNSQMIKIYQKQAAKVIQKAELLYLDMIASGEVSIGALYRQDRYYKLLAAINKNLRALGAEEIKILDSGLRNLYEQTYSHVTNDSFTIVNNRIVTEAINQTWCADGLHYSDRVWRDTTRLQGALNEVLMDAVVQGVSHQKLSKDLMHQFGVTESSAERIVRTELNRIQNKAAARGYEDAGFDQYQFLATADNRTCDECKDLDGQVFYFKDAVEGINFPPMHPNCRGTIIAYRGGK